MKTKSVIVEYFSSTRYYNVEPPPTLFPMARSLLFTELWASASLWCFHLISVYVLVLSVIAPMTSFSLLPCRWKHRGLSENSVGLCAGWRWVNYNAARSTSRAQTFVMTTHSLDCIHFVFFVVVFFFKCTLRSLQCSKNQSRAFVSLLKPILYIWWSWQMWNVENELKG